MCRVHNSTVSRQLRYALMRESVPQPVTCNEAPCAVVTCCDKNEFGMKSSLIYGKIKKIPQIDKLNGALINVRTRATKNKKQSKNKLIGMLEELFSKSEFIEKKKILEEDYGLKMSMELEGRMSEMCNVSDYWEEVATEEGKEIGERQKVISQVVKKLQKDKSVAEIADDLEEKEEDIAPIYEAALSMKPDYDVEKIYEILEKNKKLA